MPKIRCRCGESLGWGEIPNPIEWLLIADTAFDRFKGLSDTEQVYAAMSHALCCPACKRLLVFWRGFDAEPAVYVLDDGS